VGYKKSSPSSLSFLPLLPPSPSLKWAPGGPWPGETFTFQQNTFNPQADLVRLEVYDWDRIGKNDPLGSAVLHISKHMTAGTVDEWIALEPPHSKPSHIYGSIHVKVPTNALLSTARDWTSERSILCLMSCL